MAHRAAGRGLDAIGKAAVGLQDDEQALVAARAGQVERGRPGQPEAHAQHLAGAEVAVPPGGLCQEFGDIRLCRHGFLQQFLLGCVH